MKTLKHLGLSIATTLAFIAYAPASINAYEPAASACATDYFDSLKSRAWLEAQREITQNQNLILQPHSVLEYSCFHEHVATFEKQSLNMFSGKNTEAWGDAAGDMQTLVTGLVKKPLEDYKRQNFAPTYMGGRAEKINIPAANGTYKCQTMNIVWDMAKCMNFTDKPDQDGFFSFDHYQSNPDKRTLPNQCPSNEQWQVEYQMLFDIKQ